MKISGAGVWCLFLIFAASSCTEFFSTSWAPWAARNPDDLVPPVSAGNVEELVQEAENNPDLSYSLLKKIEEAAAGSGGDEAAALQAAALSAASNATGLGTAIINQADSLLDSIDNPDGAKNIITETLGTMQHLGDSGAILQTVLPEPDTPEFAAFTEKATGEDLAIAAAIMLSAEAQKREDAADYFDTFNPQNPETLTPSENLALKLAEAAAGKDDFEGRMKDILDGLNLSPQAVPGV